MNDGESLTISLASPALATRSGAAVRVAVVDSGIAAGHPHVGAVHGGAWLSPEGESPEWGDRIGHGTAVAAAIREKAPDAELLAVRVFGSRLATSAAVLVGGLAWSARHGAHVINLSLGTSNPLHEEVLAEAVADAAARGSLVVAAAPDADHRWLPGALPGVVGVRGDPSVSRDALRIRRTPLGTWLECSPYPRPIEGVPVERNLAGASFAVANASGFVARLLEGAGAIASAEQLFDLLVHHARNETATQG